MDKPLIHMGLERTDLKFNSGLRMLHIYVWNLDIEIGKAGV